MNGVKQNPYAASEGVATDTRHLSGVVRRVAPRALQSLFLAILFCLSFLFLGCSAKNGVTDGWDYTVFFVTEYPFLTTAIVLWNALFRGILFPGFQLTTVWLPLVAGVASFLSFNPVYFRVDSIYQMISPASWDSWTSEIVGVAVMALTPSFVGILVESVGHGLHLLLKRNRRKCVA